MVVGAPLGLVMSGVVTVDKDDEQADYITPGEAANVLHVSPRTVARWAQRGYIPCIVTLGGHRRLRRADVEALLKAMKRET